MKTLLLVASDNNLITKTKSISKELCFNCLVSDFIREDVTINLIILEVSLEYNLSDLFMKIFRFRCKSDIPILVICNESVCAKDKIILLDLGVDNYLVRPFPTNEYKRTIETYINRSFIYHN